MIADEIEEAEAELACHRTELAAKEFDPDATRALPRLRRRGLQMVLRLLAYNAELWLSERLDAYLADPDEVRAVTRHLLRQPGTIAYGASAITVTIDRPDQPRIARALGLLADELNATLARIPGDDVRSPPPAPGPGVQAGAPRAAAPARRLPASRGGEHGHQRAGHRLGAPARAGPAEPLGGPARGGPGASPATCGRSTRRPRCPRQACLRAATHEALFGLLATTGMRIGEAVGLDCDDVDLGAGVITIREAKFDRSRLVPLHPSTASAMSGYTTRRDSLCPRPRSTAFFLSGS